MSLPLSAFTWITALGLAISSAQAVPITATPGSDPGNSWAGPGAAPALSLPADMHANPSAPVPPEVLAKLRDSGNAQALRQMGQELKLRLDRSPGDPFLMHALATVMFREGSEREARALWAAASKREPNLASADLMASVHHLFTLQGKGAQAEAKRQLAAMETKYAADPLFLLMQGEQAVRARNLKAAESAYRRAYELAPTLYVTSLNLARFVDAARNDVESATRLYTHASRLAPTRPEVWNNYGVFLLRHHQTGSALDAFRKVNSLDASAPMAERRMGDLSASLGRDDEARRWYQAAQLLKPSEAERQAIRAALGHVLLRLKRHDEARKEMEAVLQTQELPAVVFALGTIDEVQGKLQAAEARYRQTLKLLPGNPLAANNLAMLLLKSGKSAAEALELSGQARRALPGNAIVEGTWGCALVANSQPEQAVKVLEDVVKAVPDDPWARYCLGKGLIAQRRGKEAGPHLLRTLQLDERFPRRDEVNQLIAQLRP
jgi:tetratricopeptide (TPR) repeat protein